MKSTISGIRLVHVIVLAAAFGLPVFACASDEGPGGESIETDELPWMVSSTSCSFDQDPLCVLDAGSAYPCQNHTGYCDLAPTVRKCKLTLKPGKQCAPGSMRACTTLTGGRGILRCAGNCDFPSPAIGGCVACGAAGQTCCVGGCEAGYTCSDIANPATATCL